MPDFQLVRTADLPLFDTYTGNELAVVTLNGETGNLPVSLLPVNSPDSAAQILTFSVTGAATVELPANTLVAAFVATGSPGAVLVGTSIGGGQMVDDEISSGALVYTALPIAFFAAAQTLHFTGTFNARLYIWT
jgi:hypothetical protein